jgi:hypothetical protein
MQEKNQRKYYLFTLSNFISAFGGGMVLSKCINIIKDGMFQGSSVFAFFIGTALGLVFLQLIPKKMAKNAGRWFATCGGVASLFLLLLFNNFAIDESLYGFAATLFFTVLCIRFGFWFYSRVLRASEAAGYQQNIAWLELGYSCGTILGLVIWQLANLEISISTVLVIDALVQFFSGSLDYLCAVKEPLQASNAKIKNDTLTLKKQSNPLNWCWRLTIAVMLLTVGVQVIIFALAHQSLAHLSSYMIATFYLGTTASAFTYKKLKIALDWSYKNDVGHATIHLHRYKVNFTAFNLLSAILVCLAIIAAFFYSSTLYIILFLSIFSASLIYEISTLAIMDRIGLEEKSANQSGMVIRAYGLMGIGAAVSFGLIDSITSTSTNLLLMMLACFLFSAWVLSKRKPLT